LQEIFTRENVQKWAPLLVLVALILFFSIVNPNFLSIRNAARIAMASTPALMIAIGVTFIIIMGSIDLSMEGSVAICAVIFATVLLALGGTLSSWGWLAIPASVIVGVMFGALNGLVHVKLRIPSFMASLSMGFVGIGLSLLMTGGDRIRVEAPLFRSLLTERVLNFPLMVYFALLALLVAWFIQSQTKIGRNFYAVGGGEGFAAKTAVLRIAADKFIENRIGNAVGHLVRVAFGNGFRCEQIVG